MSIAADRLATLLLITARPVRVGRKSEAPSAECKPMEYCIHARLPPQPRSLRHLFFTVNLLERRSQLLTEHIDGLRHAVRQTRQRQPFHIDAWVVLPDHLHCIWTLPPGDADYSSRWRAIKITFAKSLAKTEYISEARKKRGERGLWQRRFWEHSVRDERDYAAHMDYVYINPLKHRLVQRVRDWPYSSFHRDVRNGVYPADWAGLIPKIETGERGA